MGRIVMKFGGSSVSTAERIVSVAEIVRSRSERNPIVVVSAMGVAEKGETKITDQLETMAWLAHRGDDHAENLAKIREKHEKALEALELDWSTIEPVWAKLEAALKNTERGYQQFLDETFSFGERLSSRIMASVLSKLGTPALAVDVEDLDIIADDIFQDATLLPGCEDQVLQKYRNEKKTLVIPGFVGKTTDGAIVTLGRGGSDYTAALAGAAFDVDEIQIWTDVSGMRCTDPRIIQDAERLETISFDEAKELASFGAKVLHPKTIEPAMAKNIPVNILNTFAPELPGTIIKHEKIKHGKVIKALASKTGVHRVDVESSRMLGAPGYLAKVFEVFAKHQTSVDVVATSEVSVSLTVNDGRNLDSIKRELKDIATVEVASGKTIICVVGEGMSHTPGVSGKVFSTLGTAGVNVELISQGSSEINITFMVDDSDAERAIKALYYACIS